MKLKNILAGLMAVVVAAATLISGSVTASADNNGGTAAYVQGYWNSDGYYSVLIGNFGLTAYMYGAVMLMDKYDYEFGWFDTWIKIDNYSEICIHVVNENGFVVTPYVGTDYDSNEIYAATMFLNDDFTDDGFVMNIPEGSTLLNALATCDSVTIYGLTVFTSQDGEQHTYGLGEVSVNPSFIGLKEYLNDISTLKFGKISNKTYTGKAITPTVTVKDGDKKLVKGTDYTVSYKNNTKIGTATVTITGKGDYTGTKTLTFKIVPKKVKLTGKSSGTKENLSWKKSAGAAGYEVYRSIDGGKFTRLTATKTLKYTAKLTAGKSYKFKVRPYATVNGKKVYGSWSNVVSVK